VNGNKLGKNMLIKMKTSVVVAVLLLAISAHANGSGIAAPAKINVAAIKASFSELPAVEIPVKASELLSAATKETKIETAKAILKTALEQRPQMAIQLVASLAKASPESASQIATLALAIVPQYGDALIRVAAVNAPAYAAEIAAAAVAAYPASQDQITKWVSLAVPSASAAVANAVERQSTEIQYVRLITEALSQSGTGGNIKSVKETLSRIIAGDPVLQTKLAEGLQQQLNEDAKVAAIQAAASGGSAETPVYQVTVVVNPAGFVEIKREQIGVQKLTVTVNDQGVPVASDDGVVDTTQAKPAETVAEVTPASFPEPSEVIAQTGEAGADNTARAEEAAKQIIQAYNN
jgi:hypothetical protein